MIHYFRRNLAYDAWGNQAALASFRAAPETPSPRAAAILAHLVGSASLWLDRLEGRPPSMEVWPKLTLAECEAAFEKIARAWESYLARITSDDLSRPVVYTNTKGERWESRVEDVLTHVILHGSYHRGQIAILLRQAGLVPAYTDFIEAARRGHLSAAP